MSMLENIHNIDPARQTSLLEGLLNISNDLQYKPEELLDLMDQILRAFDPHKLGILARSDAAINYLREADPNLMVEALDLDQAMLAEYQRELRFSAATEMPIDNQGDRPVDRMAMMEPEDLAKHFGPIGLSLLAFYYKRMYRNEACETQRLESKYAREFK